MALSLIFLNSHEIINTDLRFHTKEKIMRRYTERAVQFFVPLLMMLAIAFQTKNIVKSGTEEIFYAYALFTSAFIGACWILNVNNAIKKDSVSKFLYVLGSSLGTLAGMAIHDFIL